MKGSGVEAINRELGMALLEDGTTFFFTDYFDAKGDPCSADAAVCAVGQDAHGWWHRVLFTDFETVTIQ